MHPICFRLIGRLVLVAIAVVLNPQSSIAAEMMRGESLVLDGENPGRLLGDGIDPKSVTVRSTYLSDVPGSVTYEAGRDYRLDAVAGTIARTAGSRIPDFAANILFGKKDFDHSRFPGYGNGKFFVYVDYAPARPVALAPPKQDVSALLPKTARALREGTPIKLIAFGDSITAGGEASSEALQYPYRFAEHLRTIYPRARITVENGSTGGDNTVQGLARLDEKVLSRQPDLVLVAFGMNDHNLPGGGGVEPEAFSKNLRTIVTRIRGKTAAEVILLSTFPPNPDWHFSSHRMDQYARATEQAAKQSAAPCADVYAVWQQVLKRKDAPSLLANNINHPNDFGHWLYLEALTALHFPR